ncbi:MAG: hypothetical protein ACLPTF_12885, partial [Steroidobacteraceae bacterium]
MPSKQCGDHITGELLELASGQLKFKTDHLGTLYIDWTHIVSLTTAQKLNVELLDGKRLNGAAPEAATRQPRALRRSGGAVRRLTTSRIRPDPRPEGAHMPTERTTSVEPAPSRLYMPGYDLPEGPDGLMPW